MTVPNSKATPNQSPEYLARKAFFEQMITVFGRKPVIEVLQNQDLAVHRVHLATSNKNSQIIREIKSLASARNIEVVSHNRSELSRISRNSKQDQGVACDVYCPSFQSYRQLLDKFNPADNQKPFYLIALDGVTNPQNLGMIIRSVTASPAQGLLLSSKGNANISPLVIKASAGTVFKSNLVRCTSLLEALKDFQTYGFKLCTLSSHNATPIADFKLVEPTIFILGNESNGVSQNIAEISDYRISIPMENNVESLNVAVAAALVAYANY